MCEIEAGSKREPRLILLTHLHFNAKGIRRSILLKMSFTVCWYAVDVNMHCRIFYIEK